MRSDAAKADAAQATEFALDIASKLLARLPPEARVAGFIEPLAAAVQALPDENRQQLGGKSDPIQLVAPRALSDDERQRCEGALSKALARDAVVRVDIDPTLIAGLELASAHVVVRNSFRHDLETLKAELLAHDDERQS